MMLSKKPADQVGRQVLFDKVSEATEIPMLVLAVLMIPMVVIPIAVKLPKPTENSFEFASWFIWAAFALEYGVKIALAPSRWKFFKGNIPDLLIVVLPFLRPLRIVRSARMLRLIRLARLGAFFSEALHELTLMLRRHHLHYALAVTLILILVAGGLVVEFEKAVPEGQRTISTMADGLWWAISTITTVGYGDAFPRSPAGRGVAVFLMISGIAFFSLLTANIAAFLITEDQKHSPELQEIAEQLAEIKEIVLANERIEDTTSV
ncbi:MAG: potassium channel family protein [Actinomycetota bacterium]|nr:potassium channel family protein [Actinomycetota bacterium]